MSDRAIIKDVDMTEEMAEEMFRIAQDAIDKNSVLQEAAHVIKRTCDQKYSPTWHCIVGKNFGSSVASEGKHFAYFYIGQTAVLIWRTLA